MLHERLVEHAQEARQRVPERLLEDDQPRPRFVDGGRPLPPHLAGLPRRGNLYPQRVEQIARLRHGQVGPVTHREQVRDPPVFLHQRPAGDLGRMRREHELDLQADDDRVQRVGRDAGAAEASKRFVARADLRKRLRVAFVEPAAADPVMLLGNVRQREEVRERPRDGQRFVDGHALEDAGQRVEIRIVPAASALRQRTDPLDGFIERVVLLPPQRFAQQFAQQPHIVPQGFREILGHGGSVLRREAAVGGGRWARGRWAVGGGRWAHWAVGGGRWAHWAVGGGRWATVGGGRWATVPLAAGFARTTGQLVGHVGSTCSRELPSADCPTASAGYQREAALR